ncbi:SH3 beta-barrel fold-containing protein, partial [Salmonella enterica]
MSKQYVLQQMLFSILADGEHELIFRKADDSHRVMLATRDTVLIEVAEKGDKAFTAAEPEEKKERKETNILNVVVYDLEAKAWRSFRVDRLVSINGT